MASIGIVLATALVSVLPVWILSLVVTFWLAKRNGQTLKSMSVSPHRGITAEFSKGLRAGNQIERAAAQARPSNTGRPLARSGIDMDLTGPQRSRDGEVSGMLSDSDFRVRNSLGPPLRSAGPDLSQIAQIGRDGLAIGQPRSLHWS